MTGRFFFLSVYQYKPNHDSARKYPNAALKLCLYTADAMSTMSDNKTKNRKISIFSRKLPSP